MSHYLNVLFCTDFSRNADHAFEVASDFASAAGAHLSVIHVIPRDRGESRNSQPSEQEATRESEMRTLLERTYGSRAVVPTQVTVRHGHVVEEILRFAAETNARLIVVGARGLDRLAGLIGGGSVADHVVKNAKVPVLVVPWPEEPAEKALEDVARRRAIPLGRTDVGRVLKEIRAAQVREESGS